MVHPVDPLSPHELEQVARPMEVAPGIVVRACETTVPISLVPALDELRRDPRPHPNEHSSDAPLYPVSPIICYPTSSGYATISDPHLVAPEARLSRATTVRILLIALDALSAEEQAALRAYYSHVVPTRHMISARDAYESLVRSSELLAHLAVLMPGHDPTCYSVVSAVIPHVKQGSLTRWRRDIQINDPKRAQAGKDGYRRREARDLEEQARAAERTPGQAALPFVDLDH